MHKCALESDRVVAVLVNFYNIVIKYNHYPSRWLKVVDVMLEKGKGPRLKKSRILEMIEADLQLVMRTCLGVRMDDRVETDSRVSKCNHGSRKGHSIENALLEKRLIFDLAKKTEDSCAHVTSDLEACYDRQLPNIGGIVEESIGVNREAIKLITKVLPRCKHFIGTTYGVGKESYGEMNELLGGTGQGNVFSGNVCKDVSCFIFKEIEKKRLGIMLTSKYNDTEVQRNVIAFVDDSDFCSSGVECERKMQEIVNYYANMHEATGGKVQKDKVMMYGWKWKNDQIVEVPMNIIINGKKIRMINVKYSVKTLGVHISPSLSWKDEFEYVKQKMKSSIKKIMTVDMKLHQVCSCFNAHMLTNVCFGCGIVNFNKKQC